MGRMKHGDCAGGKGTPTWNSWHCMVRRCKDAFRTDHDQYFGKGIEVCQRWDPEFTPHAYSYFKEDMGERPEGKTLGRRDSDGDYCPQNCRWETLFQQNSELTYIGRQEATVGGVTRTYAEWADEVGITYKSFLKRLQRGWDLDEACSIRYRRRRKK